MSTQPLPREVLDMMRRNPQLAQLMIQQLAAKREQKQQGIKRPGQAMGKGIKKLIESYFGGDKTADKAFESIKGGMANKGMTPFGGEMGMGQAAMSNLASLGPVAGTGVGAGILGGAALAGKGVKDLMNKETTKGWEGWGGRAQLGLMTGGLSEVGRAFGLGRKKTKDYQEERRGNVVNAGNQGWADFYSKNPLDNQEARELLPEDIKRDDKGNWIKADGSWDPREYAGVQGNADTFGDDWFKLSESQRNDLVSNFKDEGLYHSNKGNVLIADDKQDRAKELYNKILGGVTTKPVAGANRGPAQTSNKIPSIPQPQGSGITSGLAFNPDSSQYKSLSREQKNDYWTKRNSGV